MKYVNYLLLFFSAFLMLTACPQQPPVEDPAEDELSTNEYIYRTMKDYYLWYDKIPVVDYDAYSTPEELLDALVYKEYDRWSYVVTSHVMEDYTSGQMYGYGFKLKAVTDSDELRVAMVIKDSPAEASGLLRGQKILKINDHVITDLSSDDFQLAAEEISDETSLTFQVLTAGDQTEDITMTKSSFKLKAVQGNTIITRDTIKVGYLLFNDFIDPDATSDLYTIFDEFGAEQVDELILDLRYNSGGRLDIARELAGLINSTDTDGEIFTRLVFNNKQGNNNTTLSYRANFHALNLKRVYIITTGSTASASESVINGLEPFVDVVLIGTATHGKPVGMVTLAYKNIVLVPIMFKGYNALNHGDFFDGIAVDSMITEDFLHPLGDEQEVCVKEVLTHITTNRFSTSTRSGGMLRHMSDIVPVSGVVNTQTGLF